MNRKKVRVRVKKKKLKIRRILLCLLVFGIIGISFYFIRKLPIRNIYVIGNGIVDENEILDISGISDYPSFIDTCKRNIVKRIMANKYIRDVRVEKKFWGKVYIYIEEKKVLCIYNDKLLLEDGTLIDNTYDIYSYPILRSDISNLYDKFVSDFSKVNNDVLYQISEIDFVPNDVDNERFSLMMDDGNLVYITLSRISKINKYNSIYSSMDGKKGIVYLDSGDYVEIKEN